MPNARAWFCSTSFHGRLEMEMVSATPKLPVYCAPCDIEHDQPQDCPEHDDYEPVRGLDRYSDVKVSDLADNDWKDGLLAVNCALCNEPLHEADAVKTKAGLAHEACSEKVYPFDFGDMKRWPI